MTTVSGPGMHTFCVVLGRENGGWRFVAYSPLGEIARISRPLTDEEVAAISADRATWPEWDTWDRVWWARSLMWSIVSVVGCSADIGSVATS